MIVLVGVGSNGAVGICAARHLANHNANVFICKSRAYHLSEYVNTQKKIYQSTYGKEAQLGSLPVEPVELIIDALIGYGLKGKKNKLKTKDV